MGERDEVESIGYGLGWWPGLPVCCRNNFFTGYTQRVYPCLLLLFGAPGKAVFLTSCTKAVDEQKAKRKETNQTTPVTGHHPVRR